MSGKHDFWLTCGHHLLDRDAAGRLLVTDEFLKVYLARAELVPPPEACAAERRLHGGLLSNPRQAVTWSQIAAIADPDARENWEMMIAWRNHLVRHSTLESAYLEIVRRNVKLPQVFIGQLIQVILRNALNEAAKRPKRFKNWTHATHGLKLSILQDADSGRPFKVVTVAVKNNASESLQLLSNSPELFIETVDEKGATVDIHSIANTQIEASNTSGAIAPGATVYFAIVYVSPALDVRQHLKIVVTQTNAADQPASIKLATSGR